MAVFRIEKTRDYTVMSNHHLRNAGLSLKSKGLLSMMLSLPEDWNYTTRGLAKICKEGTDSSGSALKELERAGYIVRNRLRDSKGKIVDVEYVIYETPHPPDTGQPCEDEPDTACPDTENPDMDKLVRKYHTRDPYELCQLLGIKIHYYDLQKKLKGFFYYQSRQKNIVIDHNVNGILERILVAHELGHAVLHTKIAMMHGFQEMEVFDDRSIEENEANFFAAELLLEDGKVLECLSEHTFFETAKMLYVPAALLDYKFSLLHEKGELVNSMYIRKADFLKEDLHAYDNDIGYGDI